MVLGPGQNGLLFSHMRTDYRECCPLSGPSMISDCFISALKDTQEPRSVRIGPTEESETVAHSEPRCSQTARAYWSTRIHLLLLWVIAWPEWVRWPTLFAQPGHCLQRDNNGFVPHCIRTVMVNRSAQVRTSAGLKDTESNCRFRWMTSSRLQAGFKAFFRWRL